MGEITTEKEIQKLKLEIKSWETKFFNANQRKPLKEDIQLACEIKDAYKKYWTLKKKIESQEIIKDDVWSEKLNKSNRQIFKSNDSSKILEKFCHKIRQRSSDSSDVKSNGEKQVMKNINHVSPEMDTDLFQNSLCDAKTDYDDIDLNNLDIKHKLAKPPKIVKIDHVPRKLKSINVLSSSLDLKKLKKTLSFETAVDSEWLERCSNFDVENSYSHNVSANNISLDNLETEIYNDSVDQNIKIKQDSVFIYSPSKNLNSHQEPFHNNKECSKSQNISNDEVLHQVDEMPSLTKQSNCEVNRKISSKNFDSYSSLENNNIHSSNEPEPAIENDQKSKKRKLARTNLRNVKPSDHLERKMASGTLNENFVKVNIKKKKFSRGHKSVDIKKLKWKKWKEFKKFSGNSGNPISSSVCFKCGQVGHWAKNCSSFNRSNEQADTNFDDCDDAPLPTLEEVAALAKQSKENLWKAKVLSPSKNEICIDKSEGTDVYEKDTAPVTSVKPIYELTADEQVIDTPGEVFDSLKDMGYSEFRKGQEAAIMRILSGLSTLVVQPTGSGKSLCYQLPAYIYAKHFKCTTLVVSPLVSLMEDQVKGLPSCLHAICLHSGMTDVQKKAALEDLKEGKAQIVLVSPEAVIGGQAYGSSMLPSNMPPIAFACIDEAHCLSQWSHNFRPSYLQLYKALTECYKVKCILGLTATANMSTAQEIISHLGLKSPEQSVIGNTGIPENLHLSVSRDKDKDKALIQLLMGNRFSACASIIIYCIRRDETERLATLIRTCLQDQTSDEPPLKKSKSKKRNFVWTAEAYHAGLAPPRRRSVQKQFMNGKLRVIVATIAFGMGLDKRDVRAVIHYNLPKSFESYVQEIGRAGRDGMDSHCHLFLDSEGKDIQELQRFIYSNSTDRYVIRKLLKRVFVSNLCKASVMNSSQPSEHEESDNLGLNSKCHRHEIAFSIDETVQELDLKEENVLTLLCYLELHSKKWIEVLPSTYSTCTIRCYGGPKQLRALASKSLPVAAAFAIAAKFNNKLENTSSCEFQVAEIAAKIGWNMGSVKRALKNLEWNDQKRKTGVIVGFSNLAFHVRSPCNLSDDELDEILDFLHEKVNTAEQKEILNLKLLYSVFFNYSHPHYWACSEEAPVEFSKSIKEAVNKYFDESSHLEDTVDLDSHFITEDSKNIDISDIRSQIRDLIYTNNDQNFTGRAIARIFYGIGSPCFPSEVWGKARKFWRCLLQVNFNLLLKLANDELKKAK